MTLCVSIIIPTYNRAHLIGATLDSVLAQTYSQWECIVVDDGSMDATSERVMPYIYNDSRFQFLVRPDSRKKGSAASRNIGFEACKGDLIYWLDSDDLLVPNAFETYIQAMNEECDAVVARVTQTDLATGEPIKLNTIQSGNLLEDYYAGKVTFYVCGPLWKRAFLEKQQQLFDESLSILIDWDFTMRMLYQHPNLIYLEESLVYYRQHAGSLKTNIIQLHPEKLEAAFGIRKKHLTLIQEKKIGNVASFRKHFRDLLLQILRFTLEQKNSAMQIKYFKAVVREDVILCDFLHLGTTVFGFLVFKISGRGYRWLR
ncbi:glycosyltransferase family 2 protein [Flavobacterium orientale]|uniref:Glycosyl transferase n=1 Tax=Flavobacterium orientale TaxID=1756020 RepID=A0A916XVQ8_9FLAO|nr:glycosyltransferase [Flavobacterium orientale]GGD14924.1 glycosyl transferase [Flavobacterium orientale]